MCNRSVRVANSLKTVMIGALAAAFLAVGASSASAHVHADADDTTANGYTHVTFSVPNESPTAKTNKLVVKLPTDPPFTSVSVKPIEGWTVKIITTELPKPVTVGGSTVTKAATSVEWTAEPNHELGEHQYQTFSLSLGKLPAEGTTVMLPAAQSYSDGTVVNWDEPTVAGQAEPEHPAPSFITTAQKSTTGGSQEATGTAAPATTSNDGLTAGIWGIALGAAGLLLGGTALALIIAGRRKTNASK